MAQSSHADSFGVSREASSFTCAALALAETGRERRDDALESRILGDLLLDLFDCADDRRVIFSTEAAADLGIAHRGELA